MAKKHAVILTALVSLALLILPLFAFAGSGPRGYVSSREAIEISEEVTRSLNASSQPGKTEGAANSRGGGPKNQAADAAPGEPPRAGMADRTQIAPASPRTQAAPALMASSETGPAGRAGNLAALKEQILRHIDQAGGTFGIVVVDLVGGEEMAINDRQEFLAASTFKLPVVLHLYHLAQAGKIDLDEKMTYRREDWEDGTGQLQAVQPGQAYTLRRLAELSITASDNIAANMLIRRLGLSNIRSYARSLGAQAKRSDDGYFITTPREMSIYLKAVMGLRAASQGLGDELLGYLLNTAFNDRIPAGLPGDVPVAHKIGTLKGETHDVGIVFLNRRPYILVEMTRGIGEGDAAGAEALISKSVYEYMSRLPR